MTPVFVVGASRSGTNLVRALLNRHSTALGVRRDALLRRPAAAAPGSGTERLEGAAASAASATSSRSSTGPSARRATSASKVDSRDLRSLADELGGTGDAYFEALCRLRARRHEKAALGREDAAPRLPDRRPARRLPGREGRLPRRDPRAVVASYRDWHGAAARRGVTERGGAPGRPRALPALVQPRADDAALARRRARLVHGVAAARARARADPALERLAEAPEAEVRDLCAWLGLEFEPAMLEIGVVEQLVRRPGGTGVATEPVDRWRQRLSRQEIGVLQSRRGPLMDELGYEREPVPTPPLRLAWALATVPFAAGRAAVVNRARLGRATQYAPHAGRRAFGRGSLGADESLQREP